MARLTLLQTKLSELEEQGTRLRRRQDCLKGERDFLIEVMLTKPYPEMAAHRELLAEWDKEIEELEQSLGYLRREYLRLKSQCPTNK